MQRLYSMFPSGMPGIGLLLLRIVGIVSLQACMPTTRSPWLLATVDMVCVALGLGLLNPIGCALWLAVTIWIGFKTETPLLLSIANVMLLSALAMLGPGAYSIDARIFGRRRIDLRQDERKKI
jgi:hypothetical protein